MRGLLSDSAKRLGNSKYYGSGLVDIKYALKHYKKYADRYSQIPCETGEAVEEVCPENDSAVQTCDDVELVEGRWNSIAHEGLVDFGNNLPSLEVGLTANELLIIKDACAKVDGIAGAAEISENHFRTSTKNVLHGKYNYVSTMRYLFRVSRKIYDSPEGTTVSSCCNVYSYNPHTDNVELDRSLPGKLKNAIQYMTAADTKIKNPSGISWQRKRGLRVLGMLMHVIGDTYAHKSKVPTICFNNPEVRNAAGSSWNEFKKAVSNGMMFKYVKDYLGSKYVDDVFFYSSRYEAAKKVSNNALRHFVAGLNDIAIDQALTAGLIYDEGTHYLREETKLAYLSKHVRWEFNDKNRALVAGTASFNPCKGEYISFK